VVCCTSPSGQPFVCAGGAVCCPGADHCITVVNDPLNCGICGRVCGANHLCCNGTCVDQSTSNCGYCGTVCSEPDSVCCGDASQGASYRCTGTTLGSPASNTYGQFCCGGTIPYGNDPTLAAVCCTNSAGQSHICVNGDMCCGDTCCPTTSGYVCYPGAVPGAQCCPNEHFPCGGNCCPNGYPCCPSTDGSRYYCWPYGQLCPDPCC
jgi:hypothetical protein